MKPIDKDNALRQALATDNPRCLPSNFAYLTLRRIQAEQRAAERRQHIVAAITVVAIALAGIATLLFFFGNAIRCSLVNLSRRPDALPLLLSSLFCLVFFLLINLFLAHSFQQKAQTKC